MCSDICSSLFLLDDGCSCLIFIGTQRNSIKQYIHITNIYIYIYIYNALSSNHWGKSYLTAEKTATGTGSYKVQTYKTRTNLHLTNLNLLNSADKPTPTTNFKRWKYEISLGYKIKMIENQKGLALQRWICVIIVFTNFHIRLKNTPLQS